MAARQVAEEVALALPVKEEADVPPQSVEEAKGELRHEIHALVTVMQQALKEMEQQFQSGMRELLSQITDLRSTQGVKTESMSRKDDVPDASSRRARKPDPESESGEVRKPDSEATENVSVMEEERGITSPLHNLIAMGQVSKGSYRNIMGTCPGRIIMPK